LLGGIAYFCTQIQNHFKMNFIKKTLGALMAAGVVALGSCGPNLPELPVSEVQPYFGDAAKTKAIDTAFSKSRMPKVPNWARSCTPRLIPTM
jgi:hypothetical protein